MSRSESSVSRRQFLSRAAAGAAVTFAAPAIITAGKTDSRVVVGEGDHKYEVQHMWQSISLRTCM